MALCHPVAVDESGTHKCPCASPDMQVNSGVSGGGDAFQCKVFVTLCKGGVFHLKLIHMLYLHVW